MNSVASLMTTSCIGISSVRRGSIGSLSSAFVPGSFCCSSIVLFCVLLSVLTASVTRRGLHY